MVSHQLWGGQANRAARSTEDHGGFELAQGVDVGKGQGFHVLSRNSNV